MPHTDPRRRRSALAARATKKKRRGLWVQTNPPSQLGQLLTNKVTGRGHGFLTTPREPSAAVCTVSSTTTFARSWPLRHRRVVVVARLLPLRRKSARRQSPQSAVQPGYATVGKVWQQASFGRRQSENRRLADHTFSSTGSTAMCAGSSMPSISYNIIIHHGASGKFPRPITDQHSAEGRVSHP